MVNAKDQGISTKAFMKPSIILLSVIVISCVFIYVSVC